MNGFLKMLCALRLPRSLVTRLGVCVQNKTERKLDSLRAFYYDVLLLTSAYSAYAVHFFLGQFPNMELMLSCCHLYFIYWIVIFLTGCLCALNYVSKLDAVQRVTVPCMANYWQYLTTKTASCLKAATRGPMALSPFRGTRPWGKAPCSRAVLALPADSNRRPHSWESVLLFTKPQQLLK